MAKLLLDKKRHDHQNGRAWCNPRIPLLIASLGRPHLLDSSRFWTIADKHTRKAESMYLYTASETERSPPRKALRIVALPSRKDAPRSPFRERTVCWPLHCSFDGLYRVLVSLYMGIYDLDTLYSGTRAMVPFRRWDTAV